MVRLALVGLVGHGALRGLLAHNSQEQSAPADHSVLFAQRSREVELRLGQPVHAVISGQPYVYRVLVHL
jgi:hypothetical protein